MVSTVRVRAAVSGAFVMALVLGAFACSSSPTPPDTFGVNVVVNAASLTTATRKAVQTGKLIARDASGKPWDPKDLTSLPAAIATGEVRFHYIPAVTTGSITLEIDAFDGAQHLLASGISAAIILKANSAVATTITLTAVSGSDGGVSDGPTGGAGGAGMGGAGGQSGTGGMVGGTGGTVGGAGGGTGKDIGVACGSEGECSSGHCADGVCCNNACTGVCESCMRGLRGRCDPIPDSTDPEGECGPMATPGGGGNAAGDGGISAPDGGVMATPMVCKGVCNGSSACRYPGAKKSCGSSWCTDKQNLAELVCDGAGSCGPTVTPCVDYACGGSACNTRCATHDDCQLDKTYCNATNMCVPKKGIAVACATNVECLSGHCAGGVCCNSACDAPSTCTETPGKCKCPGVTCAPGIACAVFYLDADSDGFGDKFGTLAGKTAIAACAGAPPSGYVADNSDCDDGDANVHPKQTSFFDVPSKTKGTYDYDCDGTIVKKTPDGLGAVCRFCTTSGLTCGDPQATCATAGQRAGLTCNDVCNQVVAASVHATVVGPPIIIPRCQCLPSDGFVGTIACGVEGDFRTCGTCLLPGTGATPTNTKLKQACR